MNLRRWWDTTFAVELLLLVITAPFLYFPERFPTWTAYTSFCLLTLGWAWRRWRLGLWFRRTPADWPLFFLFGVMLPISLWAAPEPLRMQYSIPKAYVLVWSFFLFWTMVTHGSRSWALAQVAIAGFIAAGMAIAVVAPLGMDWLVKYPGIDAVLSRIPSPLVGAFAGADSGFHPNQVAGTLLYVLPLLLALTAASLLRLRRAADRRPSDWLLVAALAGCSVVMGGVFLLTQSRSGLAGLAVGVAVMVLVNWRWGRWILGTMGVILLVTSPLWFQRIVEGFIGSSLVGGGGGMANLSWFRNEVWTNALYAIHDFPLTGVGLGTFRELVHWFYPLMIVSRGDDIGHAHNFWFQVGLDFGIPGLTAVLAIYIVVMGCSLLIWKYGAVGNRSLVIGFFGSLIAQSTYNVFDSVSPGAKTHFFMYYLFALVLSAAMLVLREQFLFDPVLNRYEHEE